MTFLENYHQFSPDCLHQQCQSEDTICPDAGTPLLCDMALETFDGLIIAV